MRYDEPAPTAHDAHARIALHQLSASCEHRAGIDLDDKVVRVELPAFGKSTPVLRLRLQMDDLASVTDDGTARDRNEKRRASIPKRAACARA